MADATANQKASIGSMLGAFVGDSLGSFREFDRGDCPDDMIQMAMTMPGGGPWRLQPG